MMAITKKDFAFGVESISRHFNKSKPPRETMAAWYMVLQYMDVDIFTTALADLAAGEERLPDNLPFCVKKYANHLYAQRKEAKRIKDEAVAAEKYRKEREGGAPKVSLHDILDKFTEKVGKGEGGHLAEMETEGRTVQERKALRKLASDMAYEDKKKREEEEGWKE
jgi:hypothetical protein